MPVGVVSWSGRPGQDELALLVSVVDLAAYPVPDVGFELPLVEQDWGLAAEQRLWVERDLCACSGVLVEPDDGLGDLRGCGGLATGLRSLDQDSAHDLESCGELLVSDAREVGGHGLTLAIACQKIE